MEKYIEETRDKLKEMVKIGIDEANLTLSLILKEKKRELGTESEIKDMLRMFGGLKENIPMEIIITQESQKINIKLENKEDFEKVRITLDNLWDRTAELASKALSGDFSAFRNLGDFND